MIRNILILTVLAALVPTAMSNISAPADAAEIALFSRASVDTDSLSITGNGDSAKMELKATNDNGKSTRVSDFQLTADNVLSTEVGDKVTVKDNVDFTNAVTTDARNNQKDIGITSNGVIDFTGYSQGVYTLDVVVDDDRAYEAIIIIGQQTKWVVDKEITRVNNEYVTVFEFPEPEPNPDPEPPKCKEGEEFIDGNCEPRKPEECDDENFGLVNGQCHFCEYRDENGECRPMPSPIEEEPEPPVVNCNEGWHKDASGTCQSDDPENPTMPSCDLNPSQPDCRTTSESVELATLLDGELPEEEELDDPEEELDEELEEEEEESGESKDGIESEQESESESEEESESGN
jgi:hypothetical protein